MFIGILQYKNQAMPLKKVPTCIRITQGLAKLKAVLVEMIK
jgi:hypothetical protein